MKSSTALLLCLLPAATLHAANLHAADELSCTIEVLDILGWKTIKNSTSPGFENTGTCDTDKIPVFKYNKTTEDSDRLLFRSEDALQSVTSKCLFSRNYQSAVASSVKSLTANTDFHFLPVGNDPRDPFLPPEGTWDTETAKGYDIPLSSISASVHALYEKPFVAECSAAVQIAQLAALSEHFGETADAMIEVGEVGIGTWTQYAKVPAIAARQSLFVDSNARRKDSLAALATYGQAAFYGQIGYMRPHKGKEFIDSLDNLGQNFIIVDISDLAVAAIRARTKPLKELSAISIAVWKDYRIRQAAGEPLEQLKKDMQTELEQADAFFKDIEIYVHPLGVKNFAFHVARQFGYNPRTPYVFDVYEDYQPGYFYNRFVQHNLQACLNDNTL